MEEEKGDCFTLSAFPFRFSFEQNISTASVRGASKLFFAFIKPSSSLFSVSTPPEVGRLNFILYAVAYSFESRAGKASRSKTGKTYCILLNLNLLIRGLNFVLNSKLG